MVLAVLKMLFSTSKAGKAWHEVKPRFDKADHTPR
jgi:hypothetical protein